MNSPFARWLKSVRNDAGDYISQNNDYGASREVVISWSCASTLLTWYVWGGDVVISEYTAASWGGGYTWAKSYVYAGSRLLSTYTNNGTGGETLEFHHPDRLGTRMVTNPSADTLYLQSTLPFGTAFASETTGSSNRLFTTYDRSPSTALDYAVNRTYSPGQGRFTTPDPIGMASVSPADPQSLNQFAYTRNTPTDFVDPTGLDIWDDIFATVQGVGAAREALRSSLCRNFLSRGGSFGNRDPRDILSAYLQQGLIRVDASYDNFGAQTRFRDGDIGAVTTLAYTAGRGLRIDGLTISASQITINLGGFFYSLKTSSGAKVNTLNEFKGLTSAQIRGAVIIHELAHAFNAIPSDRTNSSQSRANSQRVKAMCFSPVARIFNDRDEPIEASPGGISTEITPRPLEPLPVDSGGSGGGDLQIWTGVGVLPIDVLTWEYSNRPPTITAY